MDNRALSSMSTSSTAANADAKNGSLTAEVLSSYDLPYSEAPTCVSLSVNAFTLKTGPPLARHKNRNSFRFSAPSSSMGGSTTNSTATPGDQSSVMEVVAPLRELYKSTATIRVLYADHPPLEATYNLNQLRIHESKWLILNLSQGDALATADDSDEIPPTIRIKMTLKRAFPPEIAAVVGMANAWFGLIDGMEHNAQEVWKATPKPPFDMSKVMVLPAVPILATIVVASPVIAGVVMVGLPFLLPVVLMVITIVAAVLLTGASLFFSTRLGRDHLGAAMAPMVDSLLHSRAGQTLLYDTGPRPTPVSVARQVLPTGMWGKLVTSLMIDLIGSASYLLPVVGEGFDTNGSDHGNDDNTTPNLKYVSFFEELLPFTDIVPSASIGFLAEFGPKLLAKNPEVAEM
eukprot:CAMPEP_0176022028 /NCGR_PEP_ID=MMETSP0120_2-20121206/10713_1 /TAXON_ID=160619 /ORGANISM="Kryptoperidinium foliaceum, Strain CCMP 1326" /LENGTH=402 /DNA_ID=CAMNT_0017355159 /DNA_START=54 /DNA_END=1261 /DNA_ORIENTATION=+